MAVVVRRSVMAPIGTPVTLAAADDLDGDTTTLDVSGTLRVIYVQDNAGAAGTTGIDVIETSKDGGKVWSADTTLQAIAEADHGGDIVTGAALNAAGVEPSTAAIFKGGPYEGPTLVRCSRATAWTTGAPAVTAIVIG